MLKETLDKMRERIELSSTSLDIEQSRHGTGHGDFD